MTTDDTLARYWLATKSTAEFDEVMGTTLERAMDSHHSPRPRVSPRTPTRRPNTTRSTDGLVRMMVATRDKTVKLDGEYERIIKGRSHVRSDHQLVRENPEAFTAAPPRAGAQQRDSGATTRGGTDPNWHLPRHTSAAGKTYPRTYTASRTPTVRTSANDWRSTRTGTPATTKPTRTSGHLVGQPVGLPVGKPPSWWIAPSWYMPTARGTR